MSKMPWLRRATGSEKTDAADTLADRVVSTREFEKLANRPTMTGMENVKPVPLETTLAVFHMVANQKQN